MKHGTITMNAETGAPEFKDNAGILAYATDALTTLTSSQTVVVGHGATAQRVGLFLAGNVAGIHSATKEMGRAVIGVGVLGNNIRFTK